MIWLGNEKIQPLQFPDGTPRFAANFFINKKEYRIYWYFECMEELTTVLMVAGHAQDHGASVSLYMPYVPNARMDRVHSAAEIFTLRHFCKLINDVGFTSVHILDPHSNVTPALINRVVVHSPEPYIKNALSLILEKHRKRPFVVYPDEGASKRYSLDIMDVVYGVKNRDWNTGRINGLTLNGRIPENRPALIVDDICSYGGTFALTADALHSAGVENVYLFITHCEDNIFNGRIFTEQLFDGVFTTNSILKPSNISRQNDVKIFPLREGFEIV